MGINFTGSKNLQAANFLNGGGKTSLQRKLTVIFNFVKGSIDKKGIELLIKTRVSFKTRFFLFRSRATSLRNSRVAFVFSGKIGNAVQRNRFKRRIRELVRLGASQGIDYLCTAKMPLGKLTQHDWEREKESIQKMLNQNTVPSATLSS